MGGHHNATKQKTKNNRAAQPVTSRLANPTEKLSIRDHVTHLHLAFRTSFSTLDPPGNHGILAAYIPVCVRQQRRFTRPRRR